MTFDIHCHPALKSYLFEDSLFSLDLQEEHTSGREINLLRLQVDIPNMKKGDVRAAIAAHYIPERGLLDESLMLRSGKDLMGLFWKGLVKRIEKEETGRGVFDQTLESIEIFENKIRSVQSEGENAVVAHSYLELVSALNDSRIVFLNSVEGAHCLGRELPGMDDYLKNLDELFNKGVCMLTLGHFYNNDLVSPPEGIPPSERKILDAHIGKDLSRGLTPVGEQVVRRMIEKGMLIDLVHSTPKARRRIFEINDQFGTAKRPIVFSHSGVQELFINSKHPSDRYYSPDREEILKVKGCNGVIGIVFMNYWLSGRDERLFRYDPGMQYVCDTIEYIHFVTGTYDNIAIGTDFDAMNNPSDDLYNHSFMPKLWEYLSGKGISDNDLEKIMNQNALRVLKEGWER